jgi:hypothetical protein
MTPEPWTASLPQAGVTALYLGCQLALSVHSLHRWPMVLAARERDPAGPRAWWDPDDPPRVLVQLPVRDEPAVVGRLVAAAAALDWPRDRLRIQLLDDSGEEHARLGAAAVAAARARGVDAVHVRRGTREGYKAGALSHGLALDDAAFVAVLDADFVPDPDFLASLMPRFGDARVGLVQARWGHLNRDASLLTRAQAAMIDGHFLVEHRWRQRRGRFLNFNGSAGIWRRTCIERSGGWSHATVTEDLDLSYRAQLAGWRMAFAPDVLVPGELPEDMAAFRSQQHRWAKGAIQTARELLGALLAASLPWRVRRDALLHLTSHVSYPLLLLLATLLVPVLAGPTRLSLPWALGLHAALTLAGALPVGLLLARGARLAGRSRSGATVDALAALVLCAGLSWHIARAVVEGGLGRGGEFVRTPKSGSAGPRPGRPRAHAAEPAPAAGASGAADRPLRSGRLRAAELVLALAATAAAIWSLQRGSPGALAFYAVLALGFAWVGSGARPWPRAT